jgi:hypothetical protein
MTSKRTSLTLPEAATLVAAYDELAGCKDLEERNEYLGKFKKLRDALVTEGLMAFCNKDHNKAFEIELKEPEFPDGWYFVEMKQVLKSDRSDPDYIQDWVERINGEWELGGYKLNCDFHSVIRREAMDV